MKQFNNSQLLQSSSTQQLAARSIRLQNEKQVKEFKNVLYTMINKTS